MLSDFLEHTYLCHYGIKGMKWGVRRYQNKDGSLTAAGKIRYSKPITLKKGQSIYRSASSEKSGFMNRRYTYVSATNDVYNHYVNTAEGFEGAHSVLFEMETTKPLKIANVNDYVRTIEKMGFIKTDNSMTTDDKITMIRKLPNNIRDGAYGNNEIFDKITNQLIKDGYDGCVDMVDGLRQYRDAGESELTAMLIFNPSKNLKINKVSKL